MAGNEKILFKAGGDEIEVQSGGLIEVLSGGEIKIASGGTLEVDGNDLSTAELGFLDGVTAGTIAASKAVVVDANKDAAAFRNLDAAGSVNLTGGAAAAAIVQRFGATATEGLEVRVIDETVSPAAVETDLTEDVPAGAVILSVQANVETAGSAAGTTAAYGVGTAADPDKYGETTDLTKDQKISTIPDWAVLASAEDVIVTGTNGSGADGDTSPGGSVRVRIVYYMTNDLDNA